MLSHNESNETPGAKKSVYKRRLTAQAVAGVALAICTLYSMACGEWQASSADKWRQRALTAESAATANSMVMAQPNNYHRLGANDYYPASLIKMDGTAVPLIGQAVEIVLPGNKPISIELEAMDDNDLFVWAPMENEDYFHRIIISPHCENALSLGLERVDYDAAARRGTLKLP